MKARLLLSALFFATLHLNVSAAEEESAPKSSAKEALRARMIEESKKKTPPAPAKSATTTPAAATPGAASSPAPTSSDKSEKTATAAAPADTKSPAKTDAAKPTEPPAAVLPKVEVKKGRITVLDQQLAKQEQDIARERKNLKSSEVDLALNDSKVARPLAIFGGESSQFRQRVASERVELMEMEKELIEAIARAKTKEEKQLLQKELDEIKAVRRDLEKSLR